MNYRVFPPIDTARQKIVVNGRTYTGTPGTVVDVPDFDGQVLTANGWTFVGLSGPTASRPSPLAGKTAPYLAANGVDFFDTTLSKFIIFDGTTWRDPANGSAV